MCPNRAPRLFSDLHILGLSKGDSPPLVRKQTILNLVDLTAFFIVLFHFTEGLWLSDDVLSRTLCWSGNWCEENLFRRINVMVPLARLVSKKKTSKAQKCLHFIVIHHLRFDGVFRKK